MSNKLLRRAGSLTLALALVTSSLSFAPADVQAAKKPKSIKVTLKNAGPGGTKTIYAGGPAKYKSLTIKAKVNPSGASQKVKFKSSAKKTATVTAGGKVK